MFFLIIGLILLGVLALGVGFFREKKLKKCWQKVK